jgi:NNP family nitrate/nitrite transporter-like MFS transporter
VPSSDARRALLLICAFAVAVSTSYTNHGPILGLIRDEFALNAASAGGIATAFFLGTAVTMLFGGAAADRYGARPAVTAGFLVACLSTVGCGLLAPSYPALLVWRFLGGLGGGFGFAAGAAYTRGVFSGRGQHLAQGLYGASFLAGSAVTLIYMPLLAGADGDWRRAYLVSGLAVLGIWIAWWRMAPAGPQAIGASDGGFGLGAAIRARNSWLLALCHMCGFGLAMILGTWVVTYVTTSFELPLVIGGLLGSLVLILGIIARSSGGLILERGLSPVHLIRLGLAFAVVGLATLAVAGHLLPAITGLLLTGIGVGLPYAAVFNGAAESAPSSPASAQGFVGWGGVMTAIVGPPLVGQLFDATGGFASGFLVIAAFAALVLVSTLALRPFSFAAGRTVPAEA